MLGYTQTAPQVGTSYLGSMGVIALPQRKATLPGVSLPSRVVRSIMATAIFRPGSLAVHLMLRFVKEAARSSTMTWSTMMEMRLSAELAMRSRLEAISEEEKGI